MKKKLTIFTPTYNRAFALPNLYKSLCRQTDKDFIWLIVDDGSSDETAQLIASFKEQNEIPIEYFYQENHGKYVAHNCGVEKCDTELFMCVDSDDMVSVDCVETIKEVWSKVKGRDKLAGVVFPRDIGERAYFNNPTSFDTLHGYYSRKEIVGDTALLFDANILKQFSFPVISDEKFMTEQVLYNMIDDKYVLHAYDKKIYVGGYLDDGLTKNIDKTHWNSPQNTLLMYMSNSVYLDKLIDRIKNYGCYLAWRAERNLRSLEITKKPRLSTMVLGWLLSFHYKKLFKNRRKEVE